MEPADIKRKECSEHHESRKNFVEGHRFTANFVDYLFIQDIEKGAYKGSEQGKDDTGGEGIFIAGKNNADAEHRHHAVQEFGLAEFFIRDKRFDQRSKKRSGRKQAEGNAHV